MKSRRLPHRTPAAQPPAELSPTASGAAAPERAGKRRRLPQLRHLALVGLLVALPGEVTTAQRAEKKPAVSTPSPDMAALSAIQLGAMASVASTEAIAQRDQEVLAYVTSPERTARYQTTLESVGQKLAAFAETQSSSVEFHNEDSYLTEVRTDNYTLRLGRQLRPDGSLGWKSIQIIQTDGANAEPSFSTTDVLAGIPDGAPPVGGVQKNWYDSTGGVSQTFWVSIHGKPESGRLVGSFILGDNDPSAPRNPFEKMSEMDLDVSYTPKGLNNLDTFILKLLDEQAEKVVADGSARQGTRTSAVPSHVATVTT